MNIWDALEQAEKNAKDYDPVVIIKRNRTKIYAVMEFDSWIELTRSIINAGHVKKRARRNADNSDID